MTDSQLLELLEHVGKQFEMTDEEYLKTRFAELKEMTDDELLKEARVIRDQVDEILDQETREAMLEAGNLDFFMQIAEAIERIAKGRRLMLPPWNGQERVAALFNRGKNVIPFKG